MTLGIQFARRARIPLVAAAAVTFVAFAGVAEESGGHDHMQKMHEHMQKMHEHMGHGQKDEGGMSHGGMGGMDHGGMDHGGMDHGGTSHGGTSHGMDHGQKEGHDHGGGGADARRAVDFPPPMREHMLLQMRAHLESIQAIVAALGRDDLAEAGKIAETRLGLAAPGSAACDPGRAGEGGMAAMMGSHMPKEMQEMGMAMHSSANAFAVEAVKAGESRDLKPALAALATVTQNCVACHSAFKLR